MKPEDEPRDPGDERLRARFAELRDRDERRAPDFHRMWTAPRAIRSPWRLVVPATTLAAAAVLVLWCGARTMTLESSAPQAAAPAAAPPPAAAPALAAGETSFDPAPLDFLLDVPGTAPRSVRATFDSNPLQGW